MQLVSCCLLLREVTQMPSFIRIFILPILVLFASFECVSQNASDAQLEDVSELRWQNRILIIWSDEPSKTYAALNPFLYDINDRDMVIFSLNQAEIITNFKGKISTQFIKSLASQFPRHTAHYYLIGKDGGVKRTGDHLLIETIFEQIDAMPMRQLEMKEAS